MTRSLEEVVPADHPGQHLSTSGCARVSTSRASLDGLHQFEEIGPADPHRGWLLVWSLGAMRKISEEGVKFASPVNGGKLFLTPEVLDAGPSSRSTDIVLQFDECTPCVTGGHITTEAEARASMELGVRWAQRCKDRVRTERTRMCSSASFRAACSRSCARNPLAALVRDGLPGYAIGGVGVGGPKDQDAPHHGVTRRTGCLPTSRAT